MSSSANTPTLAKAQEKAIQRPRMGLCGRSQGVGRLRAALQQVSQLQLGGDVQRLGEPITGEHLAHLLLRGRLFHRMSSSGASTTVIW